MLVRDKIDLEQQGGLKPILKWAGGKRWLVPHILPIWGRFQDRRLVEPFCGGLAITLALAPCRAWANDINPHLINFYNQVQQGLVVAIEMANDRQLYYSHRSRFNALIKAGGHNTQEAAELFYYLNRTGYNGLCRFNKRGEFNVPFGRYKTINYAREFREYQRVFGQWQFSCMDFAAMDLSPDDFVYADPPYDVEFTQYAQDGFRWEDQVRLAEWLAKHKGPVVLSNQATERIVELYRQLGFALHYLPGPRMISSDGDRTPALEVLATRNI
ncbi:MAG TPA: Dam family site-specific DNA-(adenine-N6)-methyltransferase [Limnochordia bacterium]|nr:Dam family site-specific DNA-(adenine-N6)-methyltransferase [Limnochordia bacterium]